MQANAHKLKKGDEFIVLFARKKKGDPWEELENESIDGSSFRVLEVVDIEDGKVEVKDTEPNSESEIYIIKVECMVVEPVENGIPVSLHKALGKLKKV